MTPARFPHSDTPGSTLGCQLPRAYRRLLRPSSALDAKASTTCPSQLVTHTTNPTHTPTNPPPTHKRRETDRPPGAWTRQAMHTTHHKRNHTPPPINEGMPQTNKQTNTCSPTPPPLRAGTTGPHRCSRPLSRSQTTTPHHPGPDTPASDQAQPGHLAPNGTEEQPTADSSEPQQ